MKARPPGGETSTSSGAKKMKKRRDLNALVSTKRIPLPEKLKSRHISIPTSDSSELEEILYENLQQSYGGQKSQWNCRHLDYGRCWTAGLILLLALTVASLTWSVLIAVQGIHSQLDHIHQQLAVLNGKLAALAALSAQPSVATSTPNEANCFSEDLLNSTRQFQQQALQLLMEISRTLPQPGLDL